MDFKFKINTDVLAMHLLTKLKDFNDLKEEALKLKQDFPMEFNKIDSIKREYYLNLDSDIKRMLESFKKTTYFKKMLKETEKYKKTVSFSWFLYRKKINKFLKRILKIDLNIKLNVYITHPYAAIGYNANKDIFWGHFDGIKNLKYNVECLVHEAMHSILSYPNYSSDVSYNKHHAVIELISEYETHYFLNRRSTMDQGHEFLTKFRYKVYPYWLKFIGLTEKEIQKRIKIDKVYNIKIPNINDLDKMNIYEFLDYIIMIDLN